MQGAVRPPLKLSRMDRSINPLIIAIIILGLAICLMCTIAEYQLMHELDGAW
jgi:hypothetical protein